MPPASWPLRNQRPMVEVTLPQVKGKRIRRLIADTGAGGGINRRSSFFCAIRTVVDPPVN